MNTFIFTLLSQCFLQLENIVSLTCVPYYAFLQLFTVMP